MAAAADRDLARRRHIADLYPSVRLSRRPRRSIEAYRYRRLGDRHTGPPPSAHARRALHNGKHVLVEKPYYEVSQAEELAELAAANDRALMVGHTFEFSAAVNHIREIMVRRRAGRHPLHQVAPCEPRAVPNATSTCIWDLAPHDVSILRYVLGAMPRRRPGQRSGARQSRGRGRGEPHPGVRRMLCTVILSWLDPRRRER